MKGIVAPVTRRLRLRPLTEQDDGAVFEVLGDEATMRTMPHRRVTSIDGAREWLARRLRDQSNHGYSMWGLERRSDGAMVGFCGFFPTERATEVELGYTIHDRHQGQGYASEASRDCVEAALRAGFDVMATVRPWNAPSVEVAERAGLEVVDEIEDERGPLLVLRAPAPR